MTLDSVVTAILFFSCFIASDAKFPTIGKQAYNIRKFLSTDEPIWTVYTTGPTRRTCEVDLIRDLTKVSVYFTRIFFDGTTRSSKKELGTFQFASSETHGHLCARWYVHCQRRYPLYE
ncbi:hypothetical protein MTO96_029469 [Rhipicephalus appendiculatus]